ncbi:GNAT family N-acetyltransferase [Marinomonas sp.]|uniref:GNAT family N-acetyltransferase n=1 Tax=Marinomonas sp. TaxID=1904862 RepID=UPI003BAC16B7
MPYEEKKKTIHSNDLYFVPLDLDKHIALIQPWFQMDYAKFWGMQNMTIAQTRQYYLDHIENKGLQVFIGFYGNQASIVLEVYDPNLDEIKDLYPVQAGDIGMHFFAAPCRTQISGFTLTWMQKVMNFLFEELKATRIVVEPDIHNDKIHTLNLEVGFTYSNAINMTTKTAMLAFCYPENFYASLANTQSNRIGLTLHFKQAKSLINHCKEQISMTNQPQIKAQENTKEAVINVAEHLKPHVWQKVNRHLVCKAIAEFSHEQLFSPIAETEEDTLGWANYRLTTDNANKYYTFRAKRMALRHWRIDKASLNCVENQQNTPLDALECIIDFKQTLAIPEDKLPIYLDEISSTLYGAAYKETNAIFDSSALADADYQQIEAAMTEGHPGFVANNGRLGFNAFDYQKYAPETGQAFKIVWIAVRKEKAVYGCIPDLEYNELVEKDLGDSKVDEFKKRLAELNLAHSDYIFMPVHPWQWYNKINIVFASDIANQNIVVLGESDDLYKPQQSIRTYFNVTDTNKHYVKTSLSILNMGFMRGLSPYYMEGTPKINAYLNDIISNDPVLKSYGFSILQEIAAVGYRNSYFETACSKDSPSKKMLSALWRESPMQRLQADERLMSMTALLHVDTNNQSLLVELIKKSNMSASDWIDQYLTAFLQPLLHCFYAYDLVFMPHGENLILILENYVPTKVIMKDIAEESAILNKDAKVPENIARLAVEMPEEYKILGIFIDVFDGYFRHMSHILEESNAMIEDEFWRLVANAAIQYQKNHPQFKAKFESRDIFAKDFLHSCLNRLQLKNNLQMVNMADPASSLIMVEPLPNPIAPFAPHKTVQSVAMETID